MIGLTHDEMIARISRDDRRVIGLSCAGVTSYPALRRLLAALAKARPDAELLLSGHIVRAPTGSRPSGPLVLVPDMASAEAEMERIEATWPRWPRAVKCSGVQFRGVKKSAHRRPRAVLADPRHRNLLLEGPRPMSLGWVR